MIRTITHWFMTLLSLATATGVFMHDGRVDKATMTALSKPFSASYYTDTTYAQRVTDFLQGDAHTHPDHNTAKSLMTNSFAYQSPSVPPRNREERKNRLQMPEEFGRHAFDDVHMPILA